MNKLKILFGMNNWEYSSEISLLYRDSYKTEISSEYSVDSMGEPAPNLLIIDDYYVINFKDGFEIIKDSPSG